MIRHTVIEVFVAVLEEKVFCHLFAKRYRATNFTLIHFARS